MREFEGSPHVGVLGQSILAIADGLEPLCQRAQGLLADFGLLPLEPGRWYPQQRTLDAFHAVLHEFGPTWLRAIGRQVPRRAHFPRCMDTLEAALHGIDIAYQMNHLGTGTEDAYRLVRVSPRSAYLVCRNPYPCEFDRGLIEAVAARFRPADSVQARVEHLPVGRCRRQGAETCTYVVAW